MFLFRGSRWWGSWLIRLRTKSVYSHVGIALWVQANCTRRLVILEATWRGVRAHPMDDYLQSSTDGAALDWYTVTDPAIDREKVASFALRQWGKKYASLWQLAWAFGLVGSWLRRKTGGNAQLPGEDRRFFCSELVAAALRSAGWHPPEGDISDQDPSLIDPGTVALFPCLQRVGEITP